MGVTFNEATVPPQAVGPGIARQPLLTSERVKGTRILLDRLTLDAGATSNYEPTPKTISWLQLLDGEGRLNTPYETVPMRDGRSVLISSELTFKLSTDKGATLLHAEISDIRSSDSTPSPIIWGVDWTREPVFESESDGRKRIRVVDFEMCAITSLTAEMVIYPAGSPAPKFRHDGTDTVHYVCAGSGTVSLNDQASPVRPGDVVYVADGEWQSLQTADSGELRFITIHAPGRFKTVRADSGKPTAWRLSRTDIHGRMPAREEAARNYFRDGSAGAP